MDSAMDSARDGERSARRNRRMRGGRTQGAWRLLQGSGGVGDFLEGARRYEPSSQMGSGFGRRWRLRGVDRAGVGRMEGFGGAAFLFWDFMRYHLRFFCWFG